jgi:uncharacterized protein
LHVTDDSTVDTGLLAWLAVADPTTTAHWEAAREGRLLLQCCGTCGHQQFYPRPFCLACESRHVQWREANGHGRVYSMTTVRIPVTPALVPPYVLALVDLEEGPRLLTNILGDCAIGDRVRLRWTVQGGLPVPVFSREPEDRPAGAGAVRDPASHPTRGAAHDR